MGAALAAILCLAVALPARAQPAACSEAPPDAEVQRRLDALEGMIRDHEPPVRRWWTGFAILHAAMLSGAIILAASAEDEGFRNEMIVGSVSSGLALTSLVVFSPALMGAGDTLRGLPARDAAERLYKMRVAEDALRRASETVDFLRGWIPATLSLLYVSAASGTLLFALERRTGAFTHLVGGSILGLGRVLLHPTGSRDAWRRYRRAHPDAGCEPVQPAPAGPRASWQLTPAGLGLGFVLRF